MFVFVSLYLSITNVNMYVSVYLHVHVYWYYKCLPVVSMLGPFLHACVCALGWSDSICMILV